MERENPMNPNDTTLPRILLVEDDPVSQAFLAAAIEALPATIDRAESLAAARKLAARQVHAVWSRLDPWRGQLPPADVTACAGRRRIVADGLHGQSSSTTSIAPSFHGRRENTGELEPIAPVIVSCHRDI